MKLIHHRCRDAADPHNEHRSRQRRSKQSPVDGLNVAPQRVAERCLKLLDALGGWCLGIHPRQQVRSFLNKASHGPVHALSV